MNVAEIRRRYITSAQPEEHIAPVGMKRTGLV